jgi:LuxR family maltose regulon positive regulatory protein
VEALEEGLARRLILVCGPAGFGKTALLADWVRRGGRPVAWLSLDAGDNDPARFWRHAAAAVDRVRPGIAERAGPLLGPPAPPSFEGLVTALINELAAQPGDDELLLVLDDYHLIDTRQVHDSLVFLLEHLPSALHLVLASRSDPPLPLARFRAAGQLAELRAGELRFTVEEAAALMREAVDADLPGTMVAALAARTEGWAAGLQLAGLSLRGQPDVAGFVAAFSGSHRYVLDYLTDEVLEGQTDRVREFLLETSVLERLSGPLCDAVTGRAGGQAMLEQVERANLFLVPLDEVRGWWRYHQLFADLLRARLKQQQPGRAAGLHHNAAAWCEEHGLADDAVRHALAAGDTTWAARLIERHFDETFWPGERATVQRWLAALPAELAGSRPRLCLVRAILALAGGDAEGAGPPLDAVERAFTDATDEPFEPSAGQAASLLVNIPAGIALGRASLAHLRGDADGTARSRRRPWPRPARASRCWTRPRGGYWPWPSGWAAGSRRPSAPSLPASPGGGRRASATRPRTVAITWARCSGPRAVSMRRSAPTSRRWRSPRRRAGRLCLRLGSPSSAWGRWPTSGTNSRLRCARSARALSGAGSSPTPSRWPPAWPPWRGSGRPGATRAGPGRRWARPGGRRRARM